MSPLEQDGIEQASPRRGPSILLVVPDAWLRGFLRARLLERGHDAVGIADLHKLVAFVRARAVGMILIDGRALRGDSLRALGLVRARSPDVPIVLLARSTTAWPRGPWNAVLRDSSSAEDIVATIEWLLPLATRQDGASMS